MPISPVVTRKPGWLRIAIPIAVGLPAFAACESARKSDSAMGILHEPPIEIGSAGTESIRFERVMVDVPAGTVVGAHYDGMLKVKDAEQVWDSDMADGSTQWSLAASDELRRLGYAVTGDGRDQFGQEQASKPRFLLGATIKRISYDTYSPSAGNCGAAKLDVAWQLFDSSANAVVFTKLAVGGSRLDGEEAPVMRKAFLSALADITSDEAFVALVRKGAASHAPSSP